MHICRSQLAVGEGIYQNTPRPSHTTTSFFLHSPERVKERERGGGGLAGMAEESRAKSLNVPQQQHQEIRRGQPACAPVCQFTGPKWHCWEESMFLS